MTYKDSSGRFAKSRWITFLMWMFGILMLGAVAANIWVGKELKAENAFTPMKAEAAEITLTDTAKIEAAKNKIVDDISACETQGVAEPDAALLLDVNNQMSVGSLMFQIKTIQHYISKFESRDINRKQAIEIAIDHQKAHDLAYQIIFKETGGWKNWLNCGTKLNVAPKIEVLNSL